MTTELKKITPEELKEVLRLHWLWLNEEAGGVRADLSRTDLSYTGLIHANLSRAIMVDTNLTAANLTAANLSYANLRSANLADANLSNVNLSNASLYNAILIRVDLFGANLYGAGMEGANLSGGRLRWVNLADANLSYANLTNVNLTNVNLTGASLKEAIIEEFEVARRCICPVGSFIAWKKVSNSVGNIANFTTLKLEIPEDAKRVGGLIGRKCRANKVKVLEAIESTQTTFWSKHDPNFVYTVGQCVEEPKFNPDVREECTAGIHFFLTQIEAEEY